MSQLSVATHVESLMKMMPTLVLHANTIFLLLKDKSTSYTIYLFGMSHVFFENQHNMCRHIKLYRTKCLQEHTTESSSIKVVLFHNTRNKELRSGC